MAQVILDFAARADARAPAVDDLDCGRESAANGACEFSRAQATDQQGRENRVSHRLVRRGIICCDAR